MKLFDRLCVVLLVAFTFWFIQWEVTALRNSILVLEPGVCRHGAQALVGTLKQKTDDCHPGFDEAHKKELDDALGKTERY